MYFLPCRGIESSMKVKLQVTSNDRNMQIPWNLGRTRTGIYSNQDPSLRCTSWLGHSPRYAFFSGRSSALGSKPPGYEPLNAISSFSFNSCSFGNLSPYQFLFTRLSSRHRFHAWGILWWCLRKWITWRLQRTFCTPSLRSIWNILMYN